MDLFFLIPIIINSIWLGFVLSMISDFNKKLLIPYAIFYFLWVIFIVLELGTLFKVTNFILNTLIISFIILGFRKVRVIKCFWFYLILIVQSFFYYIYFLVYIQTFNKSHIFPKYLHFEEQAVLVQNNEITILYFLFIADIILSVLSLFVLFKIYINVDNEKIF